MIDLSNDIENKLKEISTLESRVFFCYPSSFIKLPCISYYEITNKGNSYADDEEYDSEIEFQIDVWAKNKAEMSSLAIEVDTKMKELGFSRTFASDAFEEASANQVIFHKSMRYSQIVEL